MAWMGAGVCSDIMEWKRWGPMLSCMSSQVTPEWYQDPSIRVTFRVRSMS